MAMLVREYGLNESRIYTFDIFEDLRDKKIDNNEFIEYVICDLNNDNLNDIDALNAEKLLNDYKHPWLILEDSHSDIARLLNHFDENGMQKGDYIIIEDTTHGVPEVQTGASMEDMEVEKQDLNCKKMDALRDWMRINQPKGYRVDSKYCDAWGYNLTFNANGYIVKT